MGVQTQGNMRRKPIQTYLLESILTQFPKRSEAVAELAELLQIGKDGIYRRLRGDTLLTPDEVSLLSRKYHVSLDAYVFQNNNTVFFSYNLFRQRIQTFEDYLNPINNDLVQLARQPNPHVYYASAEVPIFHHCFFPELISFKLYVWGRTVWDFEYLRDRPFEVDLLPYSALQMTESMLKNYRDIPSTEMWSHNILDFTLNQIEYHVISGGFKEEKDALMLCDRLYDLVNHLEKMSAHQKKFMPGIEPEDAAGASFGLYHNEMVYTNNTILVNTDTGSAIYTAFGNPNFLKSTDQRVCSFADYWFKNMEAKSVSISQAGEKGRSGFFKRLRRRIETVKKRIELHLEDGF